MLDDCETKIGHLMSEELRAWLSSMTLSDSEYISVEEVPQYTSFLRLHLCTTGHTSLSMKPNIPVFVNPIVQLFLDCEDGAVWSMSGGMVRRRGRGLLSTLERMVEEGGGDNILPFPGSPCREAM